MTIKTNYTIIIYKFFYTKNFLLKYKSTFLLCSHRLEKALHIYLQNKPGKYPSKMPVFGLIICVPTKNFVPLHCQYERHNSES